MHSRVDNTRTSLAGGCDSIGPLLLVDDSREDSRDYELLENISLFILIVTVVKRHTSAGICSTVDRRQQSTQCQITRTGPVKVNIRNKQEALPNLLTTQTCYRWHAVRLKAVGTRYSASRYSRHQVHSDHVPQYYTHLE